jgi:predicted methyltransferase
MPNDLIVLSRYQAQPLLQAKAAGQPSTSLSLDLNLTQSSVLLDAQGVQLPDGQQLMWPVIEEIAGDENGCFLIRNNTAAKIQSYSEETQRYYSLYPTSLAPTMLLSGLPMHRIKDTDPHKDTLLKIKAASLSRGRTLDTCTGLGYTAIEAAKVADEVITIELDAAAQAVARLNPWSQALFNNPKIKQIIGDSVEVVEKFEDATFSRIIHDPPMFALGGDLYAGVFYAELYRILKPGGKVFHYIGDLSSSSGARVSRGAIERMKRAGFRTVTPRPEAFGLVATR